LEDLLTGRFPSQKYATGISALQTSKFLRENGLEIEGVDGLRKK